MTFSTGQVYSEVMCCDYCVVKTVLCVYWHRGHPEVMCCDYCVVKTVLCIYWHRGHPEVMCCDCVVVCGGMVIDNVAAAQKLKGCVVINGILEIQIRGGSEYWILFSIAST